MKISSDAISVYYGDKLILVTVIERPVIKQHVIIKVHPNLEVEAVVPAGASEGEVRTALYRRAGWIDRKLRGFQLAGHHATPRNYVGGESHLYLGRRYRLRIDRDSRHSESIKLMRGTFEIATRYKASDRIKHTLDGWYRVRAQYLFRLRSEELIQKMAWIVEPPPIRIRMMKKQWGNCSPAGRLTLNLHLVKAPTECIDYVILHELCHLAEANHSKKFYRLMKQVMPDWERRKHRLDSLAAMILC